MALSDAARAQVCTASFTSIPFGTSLDILPGAAINTGASTGTISCTGLVIGFTTRVCIGMNFGLNAVSSPRAMSTVGGAHLNYDVFTDNLRSAVWPSATTSGPYVDLYLGHASATVTAYGGIYSGQSSASVGSYSDTVTPSIRWGTFLSLLPTCTSILGGASAQTPILATATIVANCSTSATTLKFGSIGLLSTDVANSSTISVTCTTNAPYWIALDDGMNVSGANATRRRMMASGNYIAYGLYLDMAHLQPWGNTQGVDTASGTGTAASTPFTVYGDVPPQTTPPPNTYNDTVTVTVNF